MHLLLYSRTEIGPGKKLQDVIKTVVERNELEIHRDLSSLCSSLCRPMRSQLIVVLFAETGEDFSDFFSIRQLLLDLPIIFIVPDRKKDTLSKAHCFFPRFVTSTDYDFVDLVMVLERLIYIQRKRDSGGIPELENNEFEPSRSQNPDVVIG